MQQELRHDEQADALDARRCIGKTRQHQVHDVVGQVVIAGGDEDLVAGDCIAAVGARLGLRGQQAQVRAALRFREAHGARPFAGHELGQPGRLQVIGPVHQQRVIGAMTESRKHAETQVRGADHLLDGKAQRLRKSLPTEGLVSRECRPARFHILLIRRLEAARRGHRTVVDVAAFRVTVLVDRMQHFLAELCRAFEHRHRRVDVEVGVARQAGEPRVVDHVIQDELHVVQRSLVRGHDPILSCAAACRWRACARSGPASLTCVRAA